MRTLLKNVYTYDELDEAAKQKARDWWAQHVFEDSCDWEFVYEHAVQMGNLLGINIDTRAGTRHEPCIWFSGFSSQGDGALFEGTYRYKKGAVKAIKAECNDAELIRIAQALQDVQRKHFYKLHATCSPRGHYSHSGCMDVDVYHYEDQYRDIGDAEDEIRQLMRDFADWIYANLEAAYTYQTSDEVVEDAIRANGYEFDEDGGVA